MPLPRKKLVPGILLALVAAAIAAPPNWWSEGNPPVLNANPANNKGPANIGQAKHMAKSALDALHPILPATAAAIEADLVGSGKPITSWTTPANQAEKDKNHAPLLIGQLKAIADPFYTHIHAAAPAWLEAERTTNGTNHPGSIFPWTSAISDDNNKGAANIGQLKAVFSLRFETLATFDSDGDGMPDLWEIDNGFDPNDPGDASEDPDGDGITNQQEGDLGSDPNSFDQIGPLNLGFGEEITDSPDLSFRPENPSDLYPEDSVPHWNAAIGQHIEIWKEDGGETYAELQSHWDAKGIEQEFDMLPGTRLTFILRYKGRYDGYSDSNPFKLKVGGAHEVLVNGQPAQTQGSVKQESFMADDTWEKYAEWHYASVTITADPLATILVPITLTLIPEDTDEAITYGGFVDLFPVDITAVFGIGPGNGANELVHTTSKENLESFLESVKVAKNQDIWIVKGKEDRLYCVEIGTDEPTLLRALGTPGHTVVFDGHANFGLGPNFFKSTHKYIDGFTSFGTGATDIPVNFRGDGSETDAMPYVNGQIPMPPQPELNQLLPIIQNIETEGWAFLIPAQADIKGTVTNFPVLHMPGRWKYESAHGVSAGSPLDKAGAGLEEYHFITASGSKRVILSAPDDDVPTLRYKKFFYNACSTGPHFIGNFDHGEFIYTNRLCGVFEATKLFVKGLIEEETTADIVGILNSENADNDEDEENTTYEVKYF